MDTYVPLISTRTVGPLGIVHLPRLWQKILLAGQDKLADGYRAGKGGADERLLTALGLSDDDTIAYVHRQQPSYLAFEAWVRENADPASLTPEAVTRFNERLLSFPKPEPLRSEQLALIGLPNDETRWIASDLNDLEDWHLFHQTLLQ
jgi:hypothetical protein